VPGGHALEVLKIPQRIAAALGGQVLGVGGPPTGPLTRMHLDQLAARVDAHQRPVGAHLDTLADQVARHRVQRLGDLDVVVAVHLGGRIDREIEGLRRRRPQQWRLLEPEHLGGPRLDRAVQAHPGALAAPRLGAALSVGEVNEGLTGEERLAHEPHHALHARLVLGVAHPRRVDHEPRDCAYSTNAWVNRGCSASLAWTIALRLSGITVANTPP
jgi:hypothetical protein